MTDLSERKRHISRYLLKSVRYWRYIILVLVVAAGGWYLTTHWSQFSRLREFNPLILAPLFLLHLIYLFLNAYIFKLLVGKFGVRLRTREYLGLTIISNFVNSFLPSRPGVLTKGVYLKKKFGFPYSKFTAYFFAQTVMIILASALCGLFSTWIASLSVLSGDLSFKLYLFFGLVLICILIPFIFTPRLPDSRHRLVRILRLFIEGWKMIKFDYITFLKIFLLTILVYIVAALCIQCVFLVFLLSIPFWIAFLMSILLTFLNYVTLTPANIGIQEAFFAFLSETVGVGFGMGLLACGLNRVVQVATVLILAPIFSYLLSKSTVSSNPIGKEKDI